MTRIARIDPPPGPGVLDRVTQWLILLGDLVDWKPDDERVDLYAQLLVIEINKGALDAGIFDQSLLAAVASQARRWPAYAALLDKIHAAAAERRQASALLVEDGSLSGLTTEEAYLVRHWRQLAPGSRGRTVIGGLIRSQHPAALRRMIELGELPGPERVSAADRARVTGLLADLRIERAARERQNAPDRWQPADVTMPDEQVVAAGGYRRPGHRRRARAPVEAEGWP